jgi:hypothetical protein
MCNSILKYMQTTGKAVGPGMSLANAPRAAGATATLNLDDMLDDLASNPLGNTAAASAAAANAAKRQRRQADARYFYYYSNYLQYYSVLMCFYAYVLVQCILRQISALCT